MTEPSAVAARVQNLATRFLRRARLMDDGSTLTSAQYSVLSTLNSHPDLSLTELARLESVSHPTMSRIIGTLIKQGLVARHADTQDKRSTRLSLTPAGRDSYVSIYSRRLALIEAILQRLKPETVADLIQALEQSGLDGSQNT
jgi:DNA-binding MarR family transcriptional regulator